LVTFLDKLVRQCLFGDRQFSVGQGALNDCAICAMSLLSDRALECPH